MKNIEQTTARPESAQGREESSASARSQPSRIALAWAQLDVGSLTVVFGLVVIAVVFQIANHNFLSPLNLSQELRKPEQLLPNTDLNSREWVYTGVTCSS